MPKVLRKKFLDEQTENMISLCEVLKPRQTMSELLCQKALINHLLTMNVKESQRLKHFCDLPVFVVVTGLF